MKPTAFEYVAEFHETFGSAINEKPTQELLDLRLKLIKEEVRELEEEIDAFYETGVLSANFIKELADISYVLHGTAVSLGIDIDLAVERVHQSNMSKLQEDGSVKYREDGKVLKGEHYKEPYVNDLVVW